MKKFLSDIRTSVQHSYVNCLDSYFSFIYLLFIFIQGSVTIVGKTSEGKPIPVPHSIHNMVYVFNVLLRCSKTLAEKASGMADEVRIFAFYLMSVETGF